MDTPQGHEENADQIAYWNGPGGQRWADRQAAQDILLKPIADLLIDRANPKAGERVIDVGCGSGATSILFGHKVAPSGHVFGIDVSGPMLERARQSAPKDDYLKTMDQLSALAFRAYRGLVYETEGFADYFWGSTVINEIATEHERNIYERLKEIAFLLGEDQ